MITIALQLQGQNPTHILCQGHADFDEAGLDIVCAAVSALTGALALGLTQVLELPVEPRAEDGLFEVDLSHLNTEQKRQAAVLTHTFRLAVEQLEGVYKGFVEVRAHTPSEDRP